MTTFFTAQEAKEQTEKIEELKREKHRKILKKNFEELQQKIKETINRGQYMCYYTGFLLDEDVVFLKKNGYKTEYDSSEECYTISWA